MSALLAGCGSPTVEEYLDGPYYLFAADLASSTSLSYSNGDGVFLGQVPARVVAVGWDARHLIAQRRPPDDRARIEYFIVERLRDAAGADREARVHGP